MMRSFPGKRAQQQPEVWSNNCHNQCLLSRGPRVQQFLSLPCAVMVAKNRGMGGQRPDDGFAVTNYVLHKTFRKLSTLNLFLEASTISSGCHPGSNVSLVSGVGTVSKKLLTETIARIFHLSRAASLPVCAPTFPRVGGLPFLWGQNEYVINVSGYVFVNGSMSEDASKFCRVLSDRDAPKIWQTGRPRLRLINLCRLNVTSLAPFVDFLA